MRVPLTSDTEVRVVTDGDRIDVRLWRRSQDPQASFERTDAGLLLPPHLAGIVAEAITRCARHATRRVAETKLWAPPVEGRR